MKSNKVAIITGASKGLGQALAETLAKKGWNLLINARNETQLTAVQNYLTQFTEVVHVAGDMRDESHLATIAREIKDRGWKVDLVVNNASALGVSPMPKLLDHPADDLHKIFHTNMIAPVSLLQRVKPFLKERAIVINISSDAGMETYETWGAYGGSKAGLDHMTAILAKEYPAYRFYSFDPGDMRTDMHQRALPGDDISDRPLPGEHAVPGLLYLIENRPEGVRHTSSSILKTQIA